MPATPTPQPATKRLGPTNNVVKPSNKTKEKEANTTKVDPSATTSSSKVEDQVPTSSTKADTKADPTTPAPDPTPVPTPSSHPASMLVIFDKIHPDAIPQAKCVIQDCLKELERKYNRDTYTGDEETPTKEEEEDDTSDSDSQEHNQKKALLRTPTPKQHSTPTLNYPPLFNPYLNPLMFSPFSPLLMGNITTPSPSPSARSAPGQKRKRSNKSRNNRGKAKKDNKNAK